MSTGVWYGAAAYALWGLFPVYWKLVQFVPADQLIAHRLAWSFLLLAGVLARHRSRADRGSPQTAAAGLSRQVIALYGGAAILLALNWFIYVWAVNHAFLVEASLGYFITPLVNVLLGVGLLRERLRRLQWCAVTLGAAGVVSLSFAYGAVPWIAIALAITFGVYGLVKKRAPYGPVAGLTVETGVLVLPAIAYLVGVELRGSGAFGQAALSSQLLVVASGIITTVPLVLFAAAVHRVPLSLIGILQYISPTLNFLLGVFVYSEPFTPQQLAGFALVWSALIVFGAEGFRARSQLRSVTVSEV